MGPPIVHKRPAPQPPATRTSSSSDDFLIQWLGDDEDDDDDDHDDDDDDDNESSSGSKNNRIINSSSKNSNTEQVDDSDDENDSNDSGSTSGSESYDDNGDADDKSNDDSCSTREVEVEVGQEEVEEDQGRSSSTTLMSRMIARLARKDPTLTEITIDEASITSAAMAKRIAEALRTTAYLQKVCLMGMYSSGAGESAAATSESESTATGAGESPNRDHGMATLLLAGLAQNASIQTLELRNATIHRETGSLVGQTIARHSRLKRLLVTSCAFRGSGLAVLFLGLQHNRTLTTLEVRSCCLGGYASDVVSATLPLMDLTSLCLDQTQLTPEGLRFLLESLPKPSSFSSLPSSAALSSSSLLELNLSRNSLGLDGVQRLAACLLAPTQKIQTLVLSSCGIDRHGVSILADCLLQNTTVHYLNVSDNAFGDRGAAAWITLLQTNHDMKGLNVQNCQVSEEPCQRVLADQLRYNNSFLKAMFSTKVSLAILDSVSLMESISSDYLGGGGGSSTITTTTPTSQS
jgi:Ran GTPase-activating protein (RanGAP) involved in mRNA processing and transport